jgi:cytoskeleton protein RodZ
MNQRYHAGNHSISAGSLLAQAREELDLTVADVARHLKISPAQVEALEAGAYERLPGRVFVRGFLRNYAKLLGVDPLPLLKSIEPEMPQPVPMRESPPSEEVVMPRGEGAGWILYAGIVAVVIVAGLAVYEFGFNEAPRGPAGADNPAGQQNADGSPTAPVPPAPGTPAAEPPAAPATPAAQSQPVTVASAPSPLVPPSSASRSAIDSMAPLPTKAANPGERELHFRFETESWVEIRDRNDKVIFSKLNRAGSEERVAATPPLKLVVGNARGVRLSYGEQAVDLTPHIGVTVARLTLQ